MKLTEHFDTFLTEVVNLNQTRIDILKARVDAIVMTLESFEVYADILIKTCPQGSWAHRTIIKSPGNTGFDADVVVFLKPHKEWSPAEYIENLYTQFKGHGTYANKVSRKTRCVTIQYSGEFSIDVVPCIRKSGLWEATEWILNRIENTEEQANPDGFNDWFKKQNGYVGKNYLIKVVRLLKYLRDIKMTFSAKSVLLTTLVGARIEGLWDEDFGFGNKFTDLPTTLRIIINRLHKYLQEKPEMPEIFNPSLTAESFTRHWDQDKYSNFRDCIHRYAEWIEDAYVEEDRDESILKWRRVFGDDFAKSVNLEKAENSLTVQGEDLTHVESPQWPIINAGKIDIIATLHTEKAGNFKGTYRSNGPALATGTWLNFSAKHSFMDSVSIKWQVVNTGRVARMANSLRGDISKTGQDIWEHTGFQGQHWVECFAVDTKNGISLGRSGRFYINIA